MRASEPILKFVGLALPPRCPGCREVVEADHRFCAACWSQLTLIAPPWCAACNAPFEFDRGPDALCGECLATLPVHDGARAAVAYGPAARTLVLKLKYGGHTGYATTAAADGAAAARGCRAAGAGAAPPLADFGGEGSTRPR